MRKLKRAFLSAVCFLKYLYFRQYCKIKKITHPDTWLIAEHGNDARDNAYALYRYIKKTHPEIKVKYVITKNSVDCRKISTADRVKFGSKEHFILFLTAGKLISSHIMGYSPDASLFSRLDATNRLKLVGQKIFLQHGIIKDDLPYLYKMRTKLDLFICATQPEYQFVLDKFGYGPDVVKCTGLARYDTLKNSPKKQILVMPTFRRYLNYVSDFKKTDYYRRWQGFLQNPELIKFLEDTKTDLIFYPHYEAQKRIKNFNSLHPRIKIADFDHYDVQQLLRESSLLITDYSSVQFDFAYLNKPVIYYQFDEQDFYQNHYAKGYFDYRKMGFGPVVTTENALIKNILTPGSIQKYRSRAKQFFTHRDQHNSERIFAEIAKLGKQTDGPLVSVIVPAYNTAAEISRCLKSLTGQTYQNLEVIVINDASTDQTLKTAQKFATDSRMKIINHRRNQGISSSRYDGITRATGKYCLFVDSDDWLEPDAVERLVSYFSSRQKPDMIRFNFCPEKGQKSPLYFEGTNLKCLRHPEQIKLLAGLSNRLNSMANCAYKTTLLRRSISKPKRLSYAEDFLTNLQLIGANPKLKLGIINDELYHYCYRAGSATRIRNKQAIINNLHSQLAALSELENLCNQNSDVYSQAAIKIFYAARSQLFCLLMCKDITKKEFVAITKKYISEPVFNRIRINLTLGDFSNAIRHQSRLFRLKYRKDLISLYNIKCDALWRKVWFYRIRKVVKNA